MGSSLPEKIADSIHPVIFYELVPPSDSADLQNIQAYVSCAIELFESLDFSIDAINIPEIRSEGSHNTRGIRSDLEIKINPGYFSELLTQASHTHFDMVLNHCTVYEPLAEQMRWFDEIIRNYHIQTVILVGGESRDIDYPGPSVTEMSRELKSCFLKQLFCGGIAIQTRRHVSPSLDEPQRMMQKIASGMQFFTSQVIFEAESMIRLIEDYYITAKEYDIPPKRLFLSFCPIANRRNLDFLRWLGVVIPPDVENKLFTTEIGIGWRSVKIAAEILEKILLYMKNTGIQVPLGLNIEHISRNNFELTKELITRLARVYFSYYSTVSVSHG